MLLPRKRLDIRDRAFLVTGSHRGERKKFGSVNCCNWMETTHTTKQLLTWFLSQYVLWEVLSMQTSWPLWWTLQGDEKVTRWVPLMQLNNHAKTKHWLVQLVQLNKNGTTKYAFVLLPVLCLSSGPTQPLLRPQHPPFDCCVVSPTLLHCQSRLLNTMLKHL